MGASGALLGRGLVASSLVALSACQPSAQARRSPPPDPARSTTAVHQTPASTDPVIIPEHAAAASPSVSPSASKLSRYLDYQLPRCFCDLDSRGRCEQARTHWQSYCAEQADDPLCEPRSRPVFLVPAPDATSLQVRMCQALDGSGEAAQRWASVRPRPTAFWFVVLSDTPAVQRALAEARTQMKDDALVSCGNRLVYRIPLTDCDGVRPLIDDWAKRLEADLQEAVCLPPLCLKGDAQMVDACEAGLMNPQGCAETARYLRQNCDAEPFAEYCPRPADLDCRRVRGSQKLEF